MSLEELKTIVENYSNMDISSKSRKRDVVVARVVFCDIAFNCLKKSYPKAWIAKTINRQHDNVIHYLNKTVHAYDDYPPYTNLKKQSLIAIKRRYGDIVKDDLIESKKVKYLKDRIQKLESKIDLMTSDSFINEISTLNKRQYETFKQRAEVMLKFVKQQ